jgi:hypothetical protein
MNLQTVYNDLIDTIHKMSAEELLGRFNQAVLDTSESYLMGDIGEYDEYDDSDHFECIISTKMQTINRPAIPKRQIMRCTSKLATEPYLIYNGDERGLAA